MQTLVCVHLVLVFLLVLRQGGWGEGKERFSGSPSLGSWFFSSEWSLSPVTKVQELEHGQCIFTCEVRILVRLQKSWGSLFKLLPFLVHKTSLFPFPMEKKLNYVLNSCHQGNPALSCPVLTMKKTWTLPVPLLGIQRNTTILINSQRLQIGFKSLNHDTSDKRIRISFGYNSSLIFSHCLFRNLFQFSPIVGCDPLSQMGKTGSNIPSRYTSK